MVDFRRSSSDASSRAFSEETKASERASCARRLRISCPTSEAPASAASAMCTACLTWRLRPASSIRISASRLAPSFVRLSTVTFDLAAIQPGSVISVVYFACDIPTMLGGKQVFHSRTGAHRRRMHTLQFKQSCRLARVRLSRQSRGPNERHNAEVADIWAMPQSVPGSPRSYGR
jgi:hypothetical protein